MVRTQSVSALQVHREDTLLTASLSEGGEQNGKTQDRSHALLGAPLSSSRPGARNRRRPDWRRVGPR